MSFTDSPLKLLDNGIEIRNITNAKKNNPKYIIYKLKSAAKLLKKFDIYKFYEHEMQMK